MKFLAPLLLITFFLLSAGRPASFSSRQKAGYYYRDSLVRQLPEYKTVITQLQKESTELRTIAREQDKNIAARQHDLDRADSLGWTQFVREMKKRELAMAQKQRSEFLDQILLDSVYKSQRLLRPLYTRVDTTAVSLTPQLKLDTIFDRNDAATWAKWEKAGAKLKNVHPVMCETLGVK